MDIVEVLVGTTILWVLFILGVASFISKTGSKENE